MSEQNPVARRGSRIALGVIGAFSLLFGLIAPASPALANPTTGFQPGNIISDANFYDGNAMTAAEVQTFLNQQVPRCTIGDPGRKAGSAWGNTTIATMCVQNLRMNTTSRAANAYCGAYTGVANESGAQIIAKVGKACGVSQRALLVMLQKEQGLIQDTWPTVSQLDWAMGYACPDTAACDTQYRGFFNQVYNAAWQIKVYKAFPNSYRYKAQQANTIQYNPETWCGTSQVYIENAATASLYIYTPYRPNQAALDAGWGTGDVCSSYGNRNFYSYYNAWFGQPSGYEVHGNFMSLYLSLGGARSALGQPTGSATTYGTSGVGQGFANGSMYWSPATGARVVYTGGIREKYWASGSWTGPLGFPNGTPNSYSTGGQGQGFENGSIYYHPSAGGTIVQSPIRDKYWAVGSVSGTLGYPTGDASHYADGGLGQGFQNGSIYWSTATGTVYIQNPIRAKYWTMNSIAGVLGYPKSDPSLYADGGLGQGFQNGSIYWRADVGAVYIQDPIRAKYWSFGAHTGTLGYPISDPSFYADGGTGQGFQHGSIYWHERTGAVVIGERMRTEFWRVGSISGKLGYPIADEVRAPDGTVVQIFEGGEIRITVDGHVEVVLVEEEEPPVAETMRRGGGDVTLDETGSDLDETAEVDDANSEEDPVTN